MISLNTPGESRRQLAERFKQLRKSRRYTQQELSKRSDVALATLRKFERTGLISLQSFLKLAFVLNKLDAIVDAVGAPPEFKTLDEIIAQDKLKERRKY